MIAGCQWTKYGNSLVIGEDTIYKWIDKHGMPAHRMGRLWKFKKDQVDAWVEAGGAATHTTDEKPDK